MTLRIYLAVRHCGHVAAKRILILTNCYGSTNLLLQKFTFTENQTFIENFILRKFGAIRYIIVLTIVEFHNPNNSINGKLLITFTSF